MMRAVLPWMRSRGDGAIVNVASTAATSGGVAGVAYTASKHGLLGATRNVAWRFRNEGIRCNAVLPGAVDSGIGKAIAAAAAAAAGGGDDGKGKYDEESWAQIE
jgi:NAD(P)-dependent dehydrogenase (short-subunit alcohol dehydrogenase family)